MPESKLYIIRSIQSMGDTRILKLFPEDGKSIGFLPGQFINLFKIDDKALTRAYSIASPPSWPYLELAIQIIGGKFTSYLDTLKVGDKIGVMGPFGKNEYKGGKKAVMIAGGIGITPMMGMIRHIAEKRIQGDFRLYYFAKQMSNTAYVSELMSYSSQGIIKADFRFTREESLPFSKERIDIEKVIAELDDFKQYEFYLCGPVAMVNSFSDVLISKGIAKEQIKADAFG
ncbi:MAG: FAD-dependent oxidoreductase [Candidatus Micrarchaeota archaeon]|nr:FAD-dependent oxidoreductase [Candidatus Micrarchaeota archaeon]